MKIAVIGLGYVGLATVVSLASNGNEIFAIEKDISKLDKLKNGEIPIYEQGMQEAIKKYEEKIVFENDYSKISKQVEAIFICVGTPENSDGSASTEFVYEVIDEIINNISKDITTIVIKSTVPVGTNTKIKKLLSKTKNKIEVVSNPEFLSQGTAIENALNPQRIVIGVNSKASKEIMKKIYKNSQNIIFTDPNTAELSKYVCNSFLALKVSYINDIANLCEILNANIDDIENVMSSDERIGKHFLKAGVGFGGSCFPKDTKEMTLFAQNNSYNFEIVKSAINTNEKQKFILLEKAKKYYKSFKNINVAVLGLAFKPNTDDLRKAPAIENIKRLISEGAKIKVYDPIAENNAKKILFDEVYFAKTIDETLENTDICFIFTEWDFIKSMNISSFEINMKVPIIIDGRNCFNLKEIKKRKVIYESVGRPIINKIVG